jgi:cytochrome b561
MNLVKRRSAQEVAHINMIIKLLHIPAYIILFAMGLLGLITIFTAGISIVLMIMDCMTIFLTGLLGLGGIIRGLSENKLSKKESVIHAIFQFIFCVDIISSIIVYRRIRDVK